MSYLCPVNRQAVHIFNAILILLFAGVLTWFIQLIPSSKNNTSNTSRLIDYNTTLSAELSSNAAKGKALFMNKCASCHTLFKDMTGPALSGFTERGPWADRKVVYEWVRDPAGFMKKNVYAADLKKKYTTMMQAFPGITNEEVDAICEYIRQAGTPDYGKPVAMK